MSISALIEGVPVPTHAEAKDDQEASQEDAKIHLIIGPEQRIFSISEKLICSKCSFFYNAFAGDFIEAKTKRITLVDDDPQRFRELQEWLESDGDNTPFSGYSWLHMSKVWLFAEKYHIDELQNTIVNALYTKFANRVHGIHVAFETLDFIAENTYPRSLLRRLFADMLTNGTSLDQLPSRLENIPPEFVNEMCLAYASRTARNGPANISLLSKPISTYHTSSASCKATAVPREIDQADVPTELYCEGNNCLSKDPPQPIRGTLHICTNHNLKLCEECRGSYRGHRKKTMSLTSVPYQDAVTGGMTVIDAQVSDSGFFCDGPKCDTRLRQLGLPPWALMSGERYHCLTCPNIDYCTICVRGDLSCKTEGHQMLRIRPTYSRFTATTEKIPIRERQRRLELSLCQKCASDEHMTEDCEAKEPVLAPDVEVEE